MKYSLGYTLVDICIAVCMITILCSIAYPSYINYLLVSRRSDAHISLAKIASLQEKHFLYNQEYLSLDQLRKDSGMDLSLSENGYYQIDVDLKYKSYLITAKAINVQASDSECKIITLDNTGQKGGTSGQACW